MKISSDSDKTVIAELRQSIKDCVDRHTRFLVTSHINPDGDAVASTLIVGELLNTLDKEYRIVIADDVPRKFDFLPGIDSIQNTDSIDTEFSPEVVFVVDASTLGRLGQTITLIPSDAKIINIDHHTSNEDFGIFNVIDSRRSSTAELVYEVFSWWHLEISPRLAMQVYTGIICDTGRFLFPNTNRESLALSAEMVEKGASPSLVAQKLYQRNSQETVQALGAALSTLEFYYDGAVACIHLENGSADSAGEVDTEGFVDFLLSIDMTEVQFFLIEKKPSMYRISFRSKQYVDVNKIAQRFGGGGHVRAAGCYISGELRDIKKQILDAIGEVV